MSLDSARTDPYNTWIDETPSLPAIRSTAERWADWSDAFQKIYRAAEVIARTPLAPKEMIGNTDTVAACMMKGYELGLDPLDSLANMYVVHGRVGFYAEFMRRRILQAGHKIRVVESTDNRCVMEGTRRGEQPQRAQFTAEQARKANLNLGSYPADKLLARATSRLCRQVFPDVLSGSLIVEDIMDGLIPATDDTELPAAAAEGPALTRKRRPRKAAAASTQPPTPAAPAADDDDLLDEPEPTQYIPQDERAPLYTDPPDPRPAAEHMEPDVREITDLLDIPIPADEEPEPITPAQLTKLSILLREAGFDDREARHDFVAAAIGRAIESAKDLTVGEASNVIDILESDRPADD